MRFGIACEKGRGRKGTSTRCRLSVGVVVSRSNRRFVCCINVLVDRHDYCNAASADGQGLSVMGCAVLSNH